MAGSAVSSRPNNLPAELTSFVGRRTELSEVKRLLGATRLVTLTGSGGAGKTRLALRAAADMVRGFRDGVWFVPLAPIDDPHLVVQAVFGALGLHDMASGGSLSALCRHLADKQLLLLLDNCEHLLDSSALLAVTLLKSCPELRVLVTSRQALGAIGESRLRVPPLALPEGGPLVPPDRLATYEAVALLADRAVAVLPSFKVDLANAAAVVRLCRRLDGMPLALELAAVRLEALSVDQVVKGLEAELPVLAKGTRGGERRQQTLEATIGWSYGLLDADERLLWARLSVFAGGFDEDAAIAVCSGGALPPTRVVETLALLVEKSVVQRDADRRPARYSMLETVRGYGRQKLGELGGAVDLQRRHRDWVHELARAAGTYGSHEVEAFDRIQLELDNVWSALDFCRREEGEVGAGVNICLQLYQYLWSRGPIGDVRRILDEFYGLTAEGSLDRGWCAVILATLAGVQNDRAVVLPALEESSRIARMHQDAELKGWVRAATFVADFEMLARPGVTAGDLLAAANSLIKGGRATDRWDVTTIGLDHSSKIYLEAGDVEAAAEAAEAALQLCRSHGDLFLLGFILGDLAEVRRRQARFEEAEALAREGIAGQHALCARRGLSQDVEFLAWVAADRGADTRAATLLGLAEDVREYMSLALLPVYQARHDACAAAARSGLGDAAFDRAFQRGKDMYDAEAMDFILERTARPAQPARTPNGPQTIDALTRRELEIARLIADGLTSQQIANKLFISERTVTTHVTNMLNKLGLRSRIQLAGWVAGSKAGST